MTRAEEEYAKCLMAYFEASLKGRRRFFYQMGLLAALDEKVAEAVEPLITPYKPFQPPNEGVDKGKLKETLREANKSFSGCSPQLTGRR